MVDIVSPEVRLKMMASNRRKDTKPELLVRRHLHAQGLRFRLDVRKLPGRPDWHRHEGCRFATTPKSNQSFWATKFARKVERDQRATKPGRRDILLRVKDELAVDHVSVGVPFFGLLAVREARRGS